jgi:hypothetical protein
VNRTGRAADREQGPRQRTRASRPRGAGFVLERLDNSYVKGDLKPFGYLYEGVARR